MTYISVDVEADGPIPGKYSMIAIGAVVVLDQAQSFLGYLRPIFDEHVPEALAVSGFSREETQKFPYPKYVMEAFDRWLQQWSPPYVMICDNNGFDWQFVNWYFHTYLGRNPFGYSSRNINDIFHGLKGDMRSSFKGLRRTKHDHNPVNDARGNAEAIVAMIEQYGLKGIK